MIIPLLQKDFYDHRQRGGFNTTFSGKNTKLSSAGLVCMHFGCSLIAQRLEAALTTRV